MERFFLLEINLILFGIFASYLTYELNSAKNYDDKLTKSRIYNCNITILGKNISFDGFVDTGNFLTSFGKPIIILDEKIMNRLLGFTYNYNINSYKEYMYLYCRLPVQIQNRLSFSFYEGIEGKKKFLPVIKCDKLLIMIDGNLREIKEPLIGIGKVRKECLLPQSLFEERIK